MSHVVTNDVLSGAARQAGTRGLARTDSKQAVNTEQTVDRQYILDRQWTDINY